MYTSVSTITMSTPRGLKPLRLRCSSLSLPARAAPPAPAPCPRLLYTNDGTPIFVHPLKRTPAIFERLAYRSGPTPVWALPALHAPHRRSPLNPRCAGLGSEDGKGRIGEVVTYPHPHPRRRAHNKPRKCLRRAALEAHLRSTPAGRADLVAFARATSSHPIGVDTNTTKKEVRGREDIAQTDARVDVQDALSATRDLERFVCGTDDDMDVEGDLEGDIDVNADFDDNIGLRTEFARFNSEGRKDVGRKDNTEVFVDVKMHDTAPPALAPAPRPSPTSVNRQHSPVPTCTPTMPSPRSHSSLCVRTHPGQSPPVSAGERVAFPTLSSPPPPPYAFPFPSAFAPTWKPTLIGHVRPAMKVMPLAMSIRA